MITFIVPDMTCGHCVATVTKAIKAVDASATINVDLPSKTLSVVTTAPAAAVSKALEEAGYPSNAG